MSRAQIVEELKRVVGTRALVEDPAALLTYEADGCVMDLHAPTLVVLPESCRAAPAPAWPAALRR
jgi:glycolate oxidase